MKKPLLLLLLLITFAWHAQGQTRYALLAGGGISFISGKQSNHYIAASGAAGLLQIRKRIGNKLSLETGIGYQLRRFGDRATLALDSGRGTAFYEEDQRYHLLNFPLQVTYPIMSREKHRLLIGGGPSYGFIVNATRDANSRIERNGAILPGAYDIRNQQLKTGLVQSDNKPFDVYVFQMAAQLHLTWEWKEHYAIRLFYDYGLYESSARAGTSAVQHLNLAGVMIGYIF